MPLSPHEVVPEHPRRQSGGGNQIIVSCLAGVGRDARFSDNGKAPPPKVDRHQNGIRNLVAGPAQTTPGGIG